MRFCSDLTMPWKRSSFMRRLESPDFYLGTWRLDMFNFMGKKMLFRTVTNYMTGEVIEQ